MIHWAEGLKHAGVSIHLICTGAGAGLQQRLWEIPGSSAYLSGGSFASFPYRQEETDETLGFEPAGYCSDEAAMDLACVAYMRSYSFGGKKPIGLGLTASVASEREHRGEHRVHACVISDDRVLSGHWSIEKGVGSVKRAEDGKLCDLFGLDMILRAAGIESVNSLTLSVQDSSALALERFYVHPFFSKNGDRLAAPPADVVLMPGSYNPPHPGHVGLAVEVGNKSLKPVVFHVTADGPHKSPLSLQDLLKRTRMLRGHDRLFTRGDALYIDKARRFPGVPIAMGADSLQRMLDPKWGQDVMQMLFEFSQLGTRFYVSDRPVDGKVLTMVEVMASSNLKNFDLLFQLFHHVPGIWDFSSTQVRAEVLGT